ncbi:DUF11 domain-containing protein [Photobacterium sp. S4TG1]|uniref:DUF11 domain-containing protein n=1 Tax=Photobacterium sp. S4TG1 TaxID=3114587 RepID=UPI002E177193|nr:DUF11 domain-containing protein [Photobacterium sp. S4TG1]
MLKYKRGFWVFFLLNIYSYMVIASTPHDVILTKTVTNITQQSEASTLIDANPGDVIEYNIYIANNTYSAISNINISTSVPLFTTLLTTIDCNDGHLPPVLNCQIFTPDGVNNTGYQGDITWQLLGKLEAGVTARVSYQVTIK